VSDVHCRRAKESRTGIFCLGRNTWRMEARKYTEANYCYRMCWQWGTCNPSLHGGGTRLISPPPPPPPLPPPPTPPLAKTAPTAHIGQTRFARSVSSTASQCCGNSALVNHSERKRRIPPDETKDQEDSSRKTSAQNASFPFFRKPVFQPVGDFGFRTGGKTPTRHAVRQAD